VILLNLEKIVPPFHNLNQYPKEIFTVKAMGEADVSVKIVVLGTGGVGKSSLTIRFIQDVFVETYDPTIEDSYRHQIELDRRPVLLEILDTAGTQQFASMRDMYMKSGEGFVLVYSIIDESTIADVQELFDNVSRVREFEVYKTAIALVGNKCDLEEEREVSVQAGQDLAKKWNVPFFETSAKTGHNINEIFIGLTKNILNRYQQRQPKKKSSPRCTIL